jgi:aspartate aminotransferase-like enzyme
MDEAVCQVASRRSLPYFRAEQFADVVKRVSADMAYVFQTAAQPLPITASGTGLMEMAVVNLLDPGATAIVFNSGTFGQRWVELCGTYQVKVSELRSAPGRSPDLNAFDDLLKKGNVDAVFINMHETSTGYLYDIEQIGSIVRRRGSLFIVDAISAIGADPFRMDAWNVDCALVGSQKALALMPGLGYIAFGNRAMERVAQVKRGRYYFDARTYARNLERGMTPFTPAMVTILQAEERCRQIRKAGLDCWIQRHGDLAGAFRRRLLDNPEFSMFPERLSNAMSAVTLPADVTNRQIIAYMKDKYDWWFAPNGNDQNHYLRVSHMGDFTPETMELVADRMTEAVENIRTKGASA